MAQHSATRKRAARRDYKRGRGFENLVAEVLNGERKGRAGNPDVIIPDPNEGGELLCVECEETKTAHLSKARVQKHAQGVRLARGRRGAPLPAYAFRRKLGPGKPSQPWVLMTLEDYGRLLERLGVSPLASGEPLR